MTGEERRRRPEEEIGPARSRSPAGGPGLLPENSESYVALTWHPKNIKKNKNITHQSYNDTWRRWFGTPLLGEGSVEFTTKQL